MPYVRAEAEPLSRLPLFVGTATRSPRRSRSSVGQGRVRSFTGSPRAPAPQMLGGGSRPICRPPDAMNSPGLPGGPGRGWARVRRLHADQRRVKAEATFPDLGGFPRRRRRSARHWHRGCVMSDISLAVGDGARRMTYSTSDITRAIRALEGAVEGLRDQLGTANRRAEQAEEKVAGLQAELVELRVSEKVTTTEAADLRQQRDAERTRADRVEAEVLTARADAVRLRCQLEQARPKPPRTRLGRLLRALGHIR